MRRNLFYLCGPNKCFKWTLSLRVTRQELIVATLNDASYEDGSSNWLCLRYGQPSACIVCRLSGFFWALWFFLRPKCFHATETQLDGDTIGDSLASILHVVTQFAHARNWLGGGHLKLVNLQNTSYQLINRLTVTGSQHYYSPEWQNIIPTSFYIFNVF